MSGGDFNCALGSSDNTCYHRRGAEWMGRKRTQSGAASAAFPQTNRTELNCQFRAPLTIRTSLTIHQSVLFLSVGRTGGAGELVESGH